MSVQLLREEREAQGSANTVQELHAEASAKAAEVSGALKRLLAEAHDAKENLEEMRRLATVRLRASRINVLWT